MSREADKQMASLTMTLPASSKGRSQTQTRCGRQFGRLKYADPQNLPSYPSLGLKKDGAAASSVAAANLGWANQHSMVMWKPDNFASASTAAVLAKDLKMAPARESACDVIGFQAAVLAAGSAQRHQQRPNDLRSSWGHSAATLAFRTGQKAMKPPDSTSLARRGSMLAAQDAMAGKRPRCKSTPQAVEDTYPDQENAATNALRAATVAHRPPASEERTGKMACTTMEHLMLTCNAPVKPGMGQQQCADGLQALAEAMAKRMYKQQQKMIETSTITLQGTSPFNRHGGPEDIDEPAQAATFNNLQAAAYRLAQERLAKLHDEYQKKRGFSTYYGTQATRTAPKKRLGKRIARAKAKWTSDANLTNPFDDRTTSRHIRLQMAQFNQKLSQVDEQKREKDREALFTAAQRNVRAQMEGLDQKLFSENGKLTPRQLAKWQVKAHKAAKSRVAKAARLRGDADAVRPGNRIDLGGGKFMDRDEVDTIAAQRVQPLLDEINEKAEMERKKQAELRAEEAKKRLQETQEKRRRKEAKNSHGKLQEHQKWELQAAGAEVKQKGKALMEEQCAAGLDAVEQASTKPEHEEQPWTSCGSRMAKTTLFPKLGTQTVRDEGEKHPGKETVVVSTSAASTKPPLSDGKATSPMNASKMKTWLSRMKRLSTRPRAKSSSAVGGANDQPVLEKRFGFVGGAKLARLRERRGSAPSRLEKRSASMRLEALAGRGEVEGVEGAVEADDTSSTSSGRGKERFVEATSVISSRPMRSPGSRFTEIME